MRKLVFIAIIAGLAMTGCTQKESEKKEGSSDKKVTTENVKLATCNINVGGIRFTKSKNGGENGIALLGDTLKFVAGPQTDYFCSPDGSVVNSSAAIFTEVIVIEARRGSLAAASAATALFADNEDKSCAVNNRCKYV